MLSLGSMQKDSHWSSAAFLGKTVSKPRHDVTSSPRKSRALHGSVGYLSKHSALPVHVQNVICVLESNLNQFRRFCDDFPRFTSSEVHAASTRLTALLNAQSTAVTDLANFASQEIKHGKERICDLNAQLLAPDRQQTNREIQSYRTIYSHLTAITNTCAATTGYLFLFPSLVDSALTMKESPILEEGRSPALFRVAEMMEQTDETVFGSKSSPQQMSQQLRLIAVVHSEVLSSSNPGGAPSDVFDICNAVARNACGANFSAPIDSSCSFKSLIACPLFLQHHETTCLGVIALIDKRLPRDPSFDQDDEYRLVSSAETLAFFVARLPLGMQEAVNALISPTTFQHDWQHWTSIGPPTVETNQAGEKHKRRFVVRCEISGKSLATNAALKTMARMAVIPATILTDTVSEHSFVCTELERERARGRQLELQLEEMKGEVAHWREKARRAEKASDDFRVACDRAIRKTLMDKDENILLAQRAAAQDYEKQQGNRTCSEEVVGETRHSARHLLATTRARTTGQSAYGRQPSRARGRPSEVKSSSYPSKLSYPKLM